MSIRFRSIFALIYVVIGGFVAWDRGYITLSWLKTLASALLSIFLWWLVLLGVNLHVH
jgi:hypothetical protein